MRTSRAWLVCFSMLTVSSGVWAQGTAPGQSPGGQVAPPPAQAPTPPPAQAIAAVVNGQPISELAVYRGLQRVRPELRERARKEIVNFLIDNTVVDQYLGQLKLEVDAKEIEDNVNRIKADAKNAGMEYAKMLETLQLTDAELRKELVAALRWDKFVIKQGDDKVLRELFEKNPEMFNDTRVQARHILFKDEANEKAAQGRAAEVRKAIENEVNQELAKLPAGDPLSREKERSQLLEKVFASYATKESACPSKAQGGELGSFARLGAMVEPFARTAFALKPYQMSEPVSTEFGTHLILATDRKPGKDVKFEDVRPFVQEVYGERLREAILTQYKPRSKIEVK